MPQKELIAIGIGLRTGVLKICPQHCQIYCDDDADPGLAYGLAAGLVHRRNDYVAPFADSRELAEALEHPGRGPEAVPGMRRSHSAGGHSAGGRTCATPAPCRAAAVGLGLPGFRV